MSNFVNRNKKSLFKKRHYVSTIKFAVSYLAWFFGYNRSPFLFESVNDDGVLMSICDWVKKGYFAIFYDYMQWKSVFGHLSFEEQQASVIYLIAHEMRHYYQLRQLDSKCPDEPKDRLASWRYNYENPKYVGDDCSVFEFFMQPMELDASLFAYVFVADKTGFLMNTAHVSNDYLKELEKYCIELFGKTNEELFPRENQEDN